MTERLGKSITCDRCGKVVFLEYIGSDTFDGGYTNLKRFETRPEGWSRHAETGDLCDECSKAYEELLQEFFEG